MRRPKLAAALDRGEAFAWVLGSVFSGDVACFLSVVDAVLCLLLCGRMLLMLGSGLNVSV